MAPKRRAPKKPKSILKRKKSKCAKTVRFNVPRRLYELDSCEMLRFNSALDAAANLRHATCSTACNLNTKKSDCESNNLPGCPNELIENPFGCRIIATALILLGFFSGVNSSSDEESNCDS